MSKTIRKIASVAVPLGLSIFAPGIGTALGSGILGAGAAGSATLGNALIGAASGALSGGGLKGAALGGLTGGVGANLGSFGKAVQGAVQPGSAALGNAGGSGILGAIGEAAPGIARAANSLSSAAPGLGAEGGLVGGGSSSFGNLASLGSFAGGLADDEALKEAEAALLAGNQAQLGNLEQGTEQQLANLETYNPETYLSDPQYLAQQKQGEKALNRTLGATGNVFSGRALQAASDLNRSLASDAERMAYQRWLERTGQKNNLIGGIAGARGATNIGNANTRAGAGIARANNFGTTLTGAFGG